MDNIRQQIFDVGADYLLSPEQAQMAKFSYRVTNSNRPPVRRVDEPVQVPRENATKLKLSKVRQQQLNADRLLKSARKGQPRPPLVGVELNPGPLTKAQRAVARQLATRIMASAPLAVAPRRRRNAQQPRQPKKRVAAPVATTTVVRSRIPQQRFLPNGDVLVSHREYFNDISSSKTAFECGKYEINPSNSRVFPWLSRISLNYESYKFKRLKFCYETEQPSSVGGSIMLGIDFDSNDPTPGDKLTLMSKKNAQRSAPWEPFCTIADPSDLNKRSSYFTGAAPTGKDPNLYNTGVLFVGTNGVAPAQNPIGELYVEYTIQFSTPQYSNLDMGSVFFYSALPGSATTSNLINSPVSIPGSNFSSIASIDSTASVVTFLKPGYYVARLFLNFATTFTNNTLSVTANTNAYGTPSVVNVVGIKDSAFLHEDVLCYIKITNIGQSVAWTASSLSATVNNANLIIASVDPAIGVYQGLPA